MIRRNIFPEIQNEKVVGIAAAGIGAAAQNADTFFNDDQLNQE